MELKPGDRFIYQGDIPITIVCAYGRIVAVCDCCSLPASWSIQELNSIDLVRIESEFQKFVREVLDETTGRG